MASYTITATPTGAAGATLRVNVLTGATESGGASDAPGGNTGGHVSFTPAFSNSFIAWAGNNAGSSGAYTSLSNNTIQDNIATTGGQRMADGYYSGTVTGGTAITVGATAASTPATIAVYEVPASGGSTPAIDGSSPAVVDETSGSSALTTASFSPPAGAVLEVSVTGANFPSAWTVTSSPSLTWTKRADNGDGQQIWTATVPSSAGPAGSVQPPATRQTPRGVAQRARIGAAGLAAAGLLGHGVPAVRVQPAAGMHSVPGRGPSRAHLGARGLPGAGITGPGNAVVTYVAVGPPAWRPQPRPRPAVRALWRGITGTAAVRAAVPAPKQKTPPRRPPGARGQWRGQAGPANAASSAPAFPAGPLGATVELLINGTWTSVTSYVAYKKQLLTIVRGHADESTVTNPSTLAGLLDNTAAIFSIDNPTGPWYGLIGPNVPIRVSIPESSSYLRLETDAVSSITCPASASIEIAGDFDVRLDVKLTSWQKCTLAARYDGGTASWWFALNSDGTLGLWYFDSGGTIRTCGSTSPVPYHGRFAVRATVAASSGTVTFYTAATISGSWTQLGSPVTTGGTSVRGGTAPIEVGYSTAFAGTGHSYGGLQGRVYGFQLYSGIGGTLVAGPDFTTATAGASTLADGQGNTWTLQGTAEFSSRKYRGHFEWASREPSADVTGHNLYMDLEGGGLLRRLQQGKQTLGSVFYRTFTQVSPPDSLVAYWPCEDGDATSAGVTPATPAQFASAVPGVAAGTFTGATPGFASDASFLCSQSLPVINGSRWHFRLPSRATADTANVLRFLLHMPSASDTNNGVAGRLYTTGTVGRFDIVYTTGGNLTMVGYDQSGNQLFSSGPWSFGLDGTPVWCSMELQASGGNVQYSVTTLQPGATTGLSPNGTVAGTIGNATEFVVNGNQGTASLQGTALGQITYQSQWETLFDFYQQLNAYQGETAGTRFARLCGEQGITFRCTGPLADTVAMGAQAVLAFVDLLQECVDADRGQTYEPRESLALAYRTRASLQNQAAAYALNYSTDGLTGLVRAPRDDQYTVNDVVVTRAYAAGGGTGSSAEAVATAGPLSIQAPPNGVNTYGPSSVTQNLQLDSQLPDAAGWLVYLGTVNKPRYPDIPYDLARHDIGSNLYLVPDVDIGDRLTIGQTPSWEPPDGIDVLVQQITETIGERSYQIGWCTVPGWPYRTGALGDTTFGVDTDGSQLHAGISSSATSMLVDPTTTPADLWTTDATQYPVDILMGGERITISAVSGSSAPQTFTVSARAVNGVVKAHSAGEAISLFQPAVMSL